MRRADYLILAETIRRQLAVSTMLENVADGNGPADTLQRHCAHSSRTSVHEVARNFSERAHLGGMSRAEFLRACGIAA